MECYLAESLKIVPGPRAGLNFFWAESAPVCCLPPSWRSEAGASQGLPTFYSPFHIPV